MIKIVTIIGARPQIIKAAALSRAIKNKFYDKITEIIVHTGQHYDKNMSQVFFDELEIPKPDYNLSVGSGGHAKQTSEMILGIESILLETKPDFLILYGDTNSTLAGAMAAAKINIPIVHIEAGLRSFNRKMPEEINRILCDHTSTLLFSPTTTGINNLINEGFNKTNHSPYGADKPGIFHCGDVMYDNSLFFKNKSDSTTSIIKDNNLISNEYILSTIHRDSNTDSKERLTSIFSSLLTIAITDNIPIVIPLHPRTKKMIEINVDQDILKEIQTNNLIKLIPPVTFLEMISLESNSKLIITDSGGVQKEAYFFKKPCIILRSETEWVEIVDLGAAIIADADKTMLINSYNTLKSNKIIEYPAVFGDGKAAEFICNTLITSSTI